MSQTVMHCCEKCQVYWTCETKWYRGEKGQEGICCSLCNYYRICLEEQKKANKKKEGRGQYGGENR